MSLLTPLYLLGALAVGLPIIFHLIQRRPRGQQEFSSLMFLRAAPPRITRRSRLTNLLLLLLRGLAIVFLAFAFARPFLPSFERLLSELPTRRVVVLLDISASMRQQDIWRQAITSINHVIDGLAPSDMVSLMTFDDQTSTRVDFPQSNVAGADQHTLIREAVAELEPGWGSTNLGHALRIAAERIELAGSENSAPATILLVTDLQEGAQLHELQGFGWPPNVSLDIRRLTTTAGNAFAQVLPATPNDDSESMRIRISQDESNQQSTLELAWLPADGGGTASDLQSVDKVDRPFRVVQVPAGRSRTIRVERPPHDARLVLQGDAQPFDNTTYVAAPNPIESQLRYLGPTSRTPGSLLYFLELAELGTRHHPIKTVATELNDTALPLDPQVTPLTIVNGMPSDNWTQVLQPYMEAGGRLLIVFDPSETSEPLPAVVGESEAESEAEATTARSAPAALPNLKSLATLLGAETLAIERMQPTEAVVVASIDFQSELFAPFAAPGYSDFTKIRFRSYFELMPPLDATWEVLARFDNDRPACLRRASGKGCCWILTSGWNKATSQLAMSTKFVPLLVTMLGKNTSSEADENSVRVGDPVNFDGLTMDDVVAPNGAVTALASEQPLAYRPREPGFHRFRSLTRTIVRAVNLDPSESRVTPMDMATLERLNVPLKPLQSAASVQAERRHFKDIELESRQRIWRWLIVATLAILAIETYLGGRTPTVIAPAIAET